MANEGLETIRTQYQQLFTLSAGMRAEVTKRLVKGNHVVEYKKVTDAPRPDGTIGSMETIFSYEVKDGLITDPWTFYSFENRSLWVPVRKRIKSGLDIW